MLSVGCPKHRLLWDLYTTLRSLQNSAITYLKTYQVQTRFRTERWARTNLCWRGYTDGSYCSATKHLLTDLRLRHCGFRALWVHVPLIQGPGSASECLLSTEGNYVQGIGVLIFFKLSKIYPIDVYKASCFDTPGSYFMTGLQYYFKESNLIFLKPVS